MGVIGLRELRQSASDIVRRVEAGETFVVTVSGRPAAVLAAPERRAWRQWSDVAEIFAGRGAGTWGEDLERVDSQLRDPWAPR